MIDNVLGIAILEKAAIVIFKGIDIEVGWGKIKDYIITGYLITFNE